MRLPTTKRMNPDGFRAEVHVATDQAMRPQGIHLHGPAEQTHGASHHTDREALALMVTETVWHSAP